MSSTHSHDPLRKIGVYMINALLHENGVRIDKPREVTRIKLTTGGTEIHPINLILSQGTGGTGAHPAKP